MRPGEPAPQRPTRGGWVRFAVGGFLVTYLIAVAASYWNMATAVEPGPATPYATRFLAGVALGMVISTLVMGRLVGIHTARQWVTAFAIIAALLLVAILPAMLRVLVGVLWLR